MWLVVGLGNPGPTYEANRHNIGFKVVDELARRWNANSGWRAKFGGEVLQKNQVVILKPQEFMNVSGQATQRTAAFHQIGPNETIVIHDEIDLDFGRLKVKVGGGHGGHNGLRSITEHLGADFLRVRCGVGKPKDKGVENEKVAGYVLSDFSTTENKELPFLIGGAADAVELILQKGSTAAMNQVNTEKPRS